MSVWYYADGMADLVGRSAHLGRAQQPIAPSQASSRACASHAATASLGSRPRHVFGGRMFSRMGLSEHLNRQSLGTPVLLFTCHQVCCGRPLTVRANAGDKDEELPWERREKLQKLAEKDGSDLPFGVYLLGSAIIAIAAVGSIFEIVDKNAIFGVIQPSSPFWLPILGFFAVTGIPSAGLLFFKAINSANAEAERQNKIDGY